MPPPGDSSRPLLQVDGERVNQDASHLTEAFYSGFEGADMDEDEDGQQENENMDEDKEADAANDANVMAKLVVESAKAWVHKQHFCFLFNSCSSIRLMPTSLTASEKVVEKLRRVFSGSRRQVSFPLPSLV